MAKERVRCPKCASDDVEYSDENRVYYCMDCDHVFTHGEYVKAKMAINRLEADWYRAAGEEAS